MTVDASGTLGKGAVASTSQVSALQSQMARVQAVSDAQFGALQGQVNTLFDLAAHDRKQMRQGVAAAMALAEAPFPPEPGQTSYQAKTAVFRGEVGFSASLSHRLKTDIPISITAGVSHSGGSNTGASFAVSGVF